VHSKFELFVRNAEKSSKFYETLGFAVIHRTDSGYLTLQKDFVVIALSPRRGMFLGLLKLLRLPPLGTEIVLYVDDLEAHREQLVRAGYRPGKVCMQTWGNRDFRVRDADGYYVRVSNGTWAGREDP